ncbi:MAG: Dabb family protein [Planctomycetota bacterium]
MARLAHHVFFTLTDRTDQARDHLIQECQKYLDGHDGCVSFSVGTREPDYQREVNADYDVSLHVVFKDRTSHDQYQVASRHLEFIEANKSGWASVQVFDSNLAD